MNASLKRATVQYSVPSDRDPQFRLPVSLECSRNDGTGHIPPDRSVDVVFDALIVQHGGVESDRGVGLLR